MSEEPDTTPTTHGTETLTDDVETPVTEDTKRLSQNVFL